jgi:hypothetical protein
MEIQAAFVVAVQVQSRLVVIASVPDMPSGGAGSAGASAMATSHLTAVGAVTEVVDEVPVHALQRSHSAHIANSRARIAASTMQAVCRTSCGVWPPARTPAGAARPEKGVDSLPLLRRRFALRCTLEGSSTATRRSRGPPRACKAQLRPRCRVLRTELNRRESNRGVDRIATKVITTWPS